MYSRYRSFLFGLAIIFLAASSQISAQRLSIKTADGYLHISNGEEVSYRVEIKGKKIEVNQQLENPAFNVDGVITQLLDVKNKNFDPTGKSKDSELLSVHMKWESDHLGSQIFMNPLDVKSESVKAGDNETLFWYFNRPKYNESYDREAFMTSLVGKDVFGISIPVAKGGNIAETKQRCIEIFKTLKVSKTQFDVQAIAAKIRAGKTDY